MKQGYVDDEHAKAQWSVFVNPHLFLTNFSKRQTSVVKSRMAKGTSLKRGGIKFYPATEAVLAPVSSEFPVFRGWGFLLCLSQESHKSRAENSIDVSCTRSRDSVQVGTKKAEQCLRRRWPHFNLVRGSVAVGKSAWVSQVLRPGRIEAFSWFAPSSANRLE